jgi:hypothetical protein
MRESNFGLYAAISVGSVALLGTFIALSVVIGEDFAIPALIAGAVMGTVVLRGPVGKALAARIHQGTIGQAEPHPEVLDELYEVRNRMVEIEERLDFTERLLARQRSEDPARLPSG